MTDRRPLSALIAATALLAATVASPVNAQEDRPLVPVSLELQEAAARALAAPWLTEDERKDLRIFHGAWDEADLDSPARRAAAALMTWRLDDASLHDPATPVELRAEAAMRRGELEPALELLEDASSIRAGRLRAQALEALGRMEDADTAVTAPAARLQQAVLNAPDLVDGVLALQVRARVQGQPARDFQTMLTLLGRAHQDLDRLYWPGRLAEAELLLEKHNTVEGVEALHETLALNPRASEAWFALGQIALSRIDFPQVRVAVDSLRRVNPAHPLAALLLAQSALFQDDPDAAAEAIEPLLARWPTMRSALEVAAAIEGLRYDDEALRAALDRYDELSPGSPHAYFTAGSVLSSNRQYELAAELLNEAARRQPNWPPPLIELGLLELQSGRDALALSALEQVAALDPYDKRVANSLFLLRELASYRQIETDHFVIRVRPGVDEIVADMMPVALDELHDELVQRFQHDPERKTVIEVMPDHQFFGVRITSMPWIHTIAACTGPVIAMEVPREGPKHLHFGPYDWLQVLRHEYVHTITLSQTRNRIPHWLTEAAAVSMELAPRDYDRCQLLARELREGTLFDLDTINWGFIRPRRPQDRSLAYAQGAWMVQFMNERFGESAVVRLMDQYALGQRESQAMPTALGVSRDDFMEEFLEWAREEVSAWGLSPSPSMTELEDRLIAADPELSAQLERSRQARLQVIAAALAGQIGAPATSDRDRLTADLWPRLQRPPVTIDDATLDAWLKEMPEHPDLLELKLRRLDRAGNGLTAEHIPLLERYMAARPVDPYPHRKLAQLYLASDPAKAIPHLEFLDVREEYNDAFALELARLYRAEGDTAAASAKALKAVRTNPYKAATRELAAALAVETGDLESARRHIVALTMLEPDRPQHGKRLEALERLMR